MNIGRTTFSQLMDFLPLAEFRECGARYQGDYKTQSFSSLDQFLCLAFAQLTYRDSLRDIETCLRDIETCLRAQPSKLYHMGFRGAISRATPAYANEHRDWRIFADFAQGLIRTARALYRDEDFGLDLAQTIKAFYGTSPNAVKTQVWIAISAYVLVAIVKKQLLIDLTSNQILQILSVTIFEKTPILQGFLDYHDQLSRTDLAKQLELFNL